MNLLPRRVSGLAAIIASACARANATGHYPEPPTHLDVVDGWSTDDQTLARIADRLAESATPAGESFVDGAR